MMEEKTMIPNKKFLTTSEAFAAFGGVVAIATFWRHLGNGIIPSIKVGNRRLIPAKYFDDLEAQAMASGK